MKATKWLLSYAQCPRGICRPSLGSTLSFVATSHSPGVFTVRDRWSSPHLQEPGHQAPARNPSHLEARVSFFPRFSLLHLPRSTYSVPYASSCAAACPYMHGQPSSSPSVTQGCDGPLLLYVCLFQRCSLHRYARPSIKGDFKDGCSGHQPPKAVVTEPTNMSVFS